ncbi:hypothetical protein KQ302_08405 [Synechococcus sp. CS-602]|uniref:hypothetical protein n=1 Tax=Synechococcaceae TaxID=1890426 RepID=UPI0008FF1202|nr:MULTISPECIES: hypothetical protein [Synechococcaceae]APD48616.1 hypothetical protein BM449_10720 [Synechococcus sp. SynAce01]MCT0205114.1 hypothetical protein [Synechococcus sp. CS-602]MCT4365260.1 hypothetical protein [Candidatus Regnicoccus frigidus MAG-AL1]MCT4367370.1 hypothetical protein [Candidatus Regnicoccus frigidus MAG-AL2]
MLTVGCWLVISARLAGFQNLQAPLMPPGPRQISEDRDHPDDALAAVIAQTVDEEDEETLREIKN